MANEHILTEADRHPVQPSKKIAKVAPAHMGHVHLTFEDGSMDVVRREEHKGHEFKVGDYWPEVPVAEILGEEAETGVRTEQQSPVQSDELVGRHEGEQGNSEGPSDAGQAQS